ncbi:MAG TPA: hypothetical protein VF841_14940 [Anaeromyxobacter sp.]
MDRDGSDGRGGMPWSAPDAVPGVRPGVPRTHRPAADPGAHWDRPEQQRGTPLLGRSGLREATPVFGTAQPARGLSGLVRRAAYRVPEHRAGRWALLLLGDRIDVIEQRVARGWWLLPAAAAFALGYALVARAADRR